MTVAPPVSCCQASTDQTIHALLPPSRYQQNRPVRPPRANVFSLKPEAQRSNGRMVNSDSMQPVYCRNSSATPSRPHHKMTNATASLAAPIAPPERARQSVFAGNPGDGPEAAARHAAPFPAYRMDRASARVHGVVSGMQAPGPWDSKDERHLRRPHQHTASLNIFGRLAKKTLYFPRNFRRY